MLAAVTFDATGTLFALGDLAATYRRVLGRHGIELAPETLARLLGEVWQEFECAARPERDRFAAHPGGALGFWSDVVTRVCLRAGAGAPSRFACAELFETFARAEAWRLDPEAAAVLDALGGRGLRLAVVSNWDERLPRLLDGLGLARRFDAIVFSQEVGVEKPHPRIFRAALARLGVPPEAALHVGDRKLEDVEGARGAGLGALWLSRAGGGDLATLAELPERLAALA
jgi:putative hydrolase of the HAD superfamily